MSAVPAQVAEAAQRPRGPRPGGRSTSIRLLFGVLFALLTGYLLSLALRPTSDSHVWLDGWGVSAFELLASALIVARGLADSWDRRITALIGLGGLSWALGDLVNTYMEVHGESPASPALFNYLWAGYFPFAYAGLMALLSRDVIKLKAANYLDGLLVLLVSSAALVGFLFASIHHAAGESTITVATNLVYPALDVPVLVLVLLGIVLTPANLRPRWYLLAGAATANALGDAVAVFPGLADGHVGNLLNAAAWPTSLILMAAAFWLTPVSARRPRGNSASGFLVPAIATPLALVILFVGILGGANRVGMGIALFAVAVSGLRFGLALAHSRAVADERERELEAAARQEHEAHEELEHVAGELRARGEHELFGAQLSRALEMADEEQAAHEVVGLALVEIAAEAPAELLLADSSQAHLRRVAANPQVTAPGCQVDTPFGCAAVRRGQAVTFESSEALDACPRLRGRASGSCSAICVPVNFMGRALGVLHATGPLGVAPSGEQKAHMETLATQAGARIGTLRAFEKTQLQASTDGLTGLINRRTLEAKIRELLQADTPFALATADLDRFKAINDTHGHEAGDRALRLFAQVAEAAIRDGDLLARWGGEEFTIVLPHVNRDEAVVVLDRIRHSLADSHSGAHPRFTVSFGVTDTAAASIEQLLQLADAGLYRSKSEGRDRVTVADAQLGQTSGGQLPSGTVAGTEERSALKPDRKGQQPGSRKGAGSASATRNGHGEAAAARRRGKVPALEQALSEPAPRPSGLEIR